MANTPNAGNVSTGKPKIGGAVFAAPIGTPLPVTATEALDQAFAGLGYVGSDGVTNADSKTYNAIKAWGGDTVHDSLTDHSDTYRMALLEILNEDVLKVVYGPDNVSGTLDSGIAVKSNANDTPEMVYVVDMILRGNILRRHVLPKAKVTSVADKVYRDTDAIAYDTTLSCHPDAAGNTHYEYTAKMPVGGGA